jgi:large subunit ribosomal protein L25
MEEQVQLEARPRGERGKNEARRLRASGQVPAVLYGLKGDSVALALDAKKMTRILLSPAGHNQVLQLEVGGGEPVAALAKDWQVDPVHGSLLHVDLLRIDLNQPIEVSVPIVTIGPAIGVKEQGGQEEMVTREVLVKALPRNVPQHIEIDVTQLQLGHSIRIRDVPAGSGYELTGNPDRVLVHVVAPRAVEVPAAEAAPTEAVAPAAEPEKKQEGGAAPGSR